MFRLLGVVNWSSISPCVIFSLFGVVVGSPGVVTGRYLLCSKTAALWLGIRHTQETPVHQWSTRQATIQHSTAAQSQLTR
jgi:hypothetical protein